MERDTLSFISLPDTPWVGVPMHLAWTWGLSNVLGCLPSTGGGGGLSELSSLLTAKGNVSLLCLGLLQNRLCGKGTPVQKGMCPGPGLFDSGINRQSASFKESLPVIIPSPDLYMSFCVLPAACPGSQHGSCPAAGLWELPVHCSSSLVASRGKNHPDA